MDTAMRDLDQLRERGDESTGRKLGLFAMAAVLAVAAVFAMGIMIGRGDAEEVAAPTDPLAQLSLAPSVQAQPAAVVEMKPETLSFPSTLTDREDPAVEATVRAAAQEHAALTGAQPMADLALPPASPAPVALPEPMQLPSKPAHDLFPASREATDNTQRLERVARHDPLVASALPSAAPNELAPHGHEGAYTLQVVSYESSEQAERFAKNLRSRNHKAFVMQAEVPGRGRFFRVRIGPFEVRKDALDYQASFERDEHMHTIVVGQTND